MADNAEESPAVEAGKDDEHSGQEDQGDDVDSENEGEGEDKLVQEAKDKISGLKTVGSSLSLLSDLNAELDTKQKELLKRVRKSVHVARGNAPNLRLAADESGPGGMKTVDIGVLLGLIEEETVKAEVKTVSYTHLTLPTKRIV